MSRTVTNRVARAVHVLLLAARSDSRSDGRGRALLVELRRLKKLPAGFLRSIAEELWRLQEFELAADVSFLAFFLLCFVLFLFFLSFFPFLKFQRSVTHSNLPPAVENSQRPHVIHPSLPRLFFPPLPPPPPSLPPPPPPPFPLLFLSFSRSLSRSHQPPALITSGQIHQILRIVKSLTILKSLKNRKVLIFLLAVAAALRAR
ncbi:unnamed protein product [Closterium sp. NIES-53]